MHSPDELESSDENPRSPAYLTPESSLSSTEYHTPTSRPTTPARTNNSSPSRCFSPEEELITVKLDNRSKVLHPLRKTCTPRVVPDRGYLISQLMLTIWCPTSDAVIYYNINGSDFTMDNLKPFRYKGPFVIDTSMSMSGSVVVKAMAIAQGRAFSEIALAKFTVLDSKSLLGIAESVTMDTGTRSRIAPSLQTFLIRIQDNWRVHRARSLFLQQKHAAVVVQTKVRQWLAVLRVARTKKRLMWDGKTLQVARVVIRLTLEGETEATFTADKQLLLRRAICSILNESVNCLLIRRVEQYKSDGERPQSRQEGEQEIAAGLEGEEQQEFAANKPVKVRVTMLALIPADRIKRFTDLFKDGLATGDLQAAMDAQGLKCKTERGLREKKAAAHESRRRKTEWRRVYVSADRFYYWNKVTGKTSWKKPTNLELMNIPDDEIPLASKQRSRASTSTSSHD